ncbi:MAG TPA: DUF1573 domain-containing protein [Polyangia bacterium]|jgi:hypothetical protein
MRKFLWLIPVTMLAFASYATAQDKPKAEKPAKAKPAKIVAAADAKCDLGDVKAGEAKDCTFKIKNEGEAEKKGVACKGAGFKMDKVDVAGGAEVEVKATYTPAKKAGKADKALKGNITCGAAKIPFTGTLKAAEAAPAK